MKYNLVDEDNSVGLCNDDSVCLKMSLKDQCCNIKKQRKIPVRVIGKDVGKKKYNFIGKIINLKCHLKGVTLNLTFNLI